MNKRILDVCCGSRMFWFDKTNKDTIYMDIREFEDTLCDGRHLSVKPDVIGDFRNIPFNDETFNMVVFDPPHLIKAGDNSWLVKKYSAIQSNVRSKGVHLCAILKKYGKLSNAWPQDIKQGFDECMRVLKPNGTLIFKWNEEQIKLKEILNCINYKPLFGNKRSKTHWLVFMK